VAKRPVNTDTTNQGYSISKYLMDNFAKEVEEAKLLEEQKQLALGFQIDRFKGKEATKEAIAKRLAENKKSFWNFDKNYFPASLYTDYAGPNKMIEDIVSNGLNAGLHFFLGPRKHGKTVTAKKLLVHLLLTGKINIAGVYAETILKSSKILKDVFLIIAQNQRIQHDYNIEVINANSNEFQIKVIGDEKPIKTCTAFSEGRSLRGYTALFGRPQFLIGDDIETLESSFAASAVELRIQKIAEAYHSLDSNGSFLILANDFLTSCAIHQIRLNHEQKLLPSDWNVYNYKAFDKRPLWFNKFGKISESQLKEILKPMSESDWQANFQNNPVPPEGDFFKRSDYAEYNKLPADARGVIYCDPNLSKKGKGDTTAIVALTYSPALDKYFVADAICKSYADSNQLLDDQLNIKQNFASQIRAIAFDGHVTQESTWTQHIRNFCNIKQIPYPVIEYKKYKVDELAKNLQIAYSEKRILFPAGFSLSETGQRFLAQFFSFSGKQAGNRDDAPDALISAFEFIHERKLGRASKSFAPIVIKDFYEF